MLPSLPSHLRLRPLDWALGCVVSLSLLASPVLAQRIPLATIQLLAAAPRSELVAKLKTLHQQVDAALSNRADQMVLVEQTRAASQSAADAVAALKAGGRNSSQLQAALQEALELDAEYTLSRSALVAAEGQVSAQGAHLIRVYDALLRNYHDAIVKMPKPTSQRNRTLKAYRALAVQRDKVRLALRPALSSSPPQDTRDPIADVRANADDDVETLLEKADLARDLQDRFLRRAKAVRKRIQELEQDAQLARDVLGHAQTERLFDENDRLLARAATTDGRFGFPRSGQGLARGAASLSSAPDEAGGAPAPPQAPSADSAVADDAETSDFGAVGSPPPQAPADPAPSAGAGAGAGAETGGADPAQNNGAGDLNTDGDNNRGAGPIATPPATFAPSATSGIVGLSSDILLGSSRDTDLYIAELMAQGRLSLPQLHALERRFKKNAKRMQHQTHALQAQARKESHR